MPLYHSHRSTCMRMGNWDRSYLLPLLMIVVSCNQ